MDKIGDVLQQLADKLGVAAEHLWPILVHQQVIDGWTHIIGACALIVAMITVWRAGREFRTDAESSLIFGAFIFPLLGIPAAVILSAGVQRVLNPEYFALRDILQML